jgi:hypothetical protein
VETLFTSAWNTQLHDGRHFYSDDLQLNDGNLLGPICDPLQGWPKNFDDSTGSTLVKFDQVFHEPFVDCRRRSLDRQQREVASYKSGRVCDAGIAMPMSTV